MGGLERRFVRESDTVTAELIDVQIEGDASLLQRGGEVQTIFHFHHFVFPGVHNETRRRIRRDLRFV
jgi:hypothetical protein